VAAVATSKTVSIALDPNCRTITGDQTVIPSPSN
jgi:hypothetical protein